MATDGAEAAFGSEMNRDAQRIPPGSNSSKTNSAQAIADAVGQSPF